MSRLVARFDVRYPGFRLHVELAVPATGVTAIFGPSGCGKTTVLRCLAGLERSPTGYVRLGDEVWQDESRNLFLPTHQRSIGYVFQELRLFPHLSVRDNLTYGYRRTPPPERRISLDQVIHLLALTSLLDRRPHQLSGGEQQRVAIGRALLASPRLLLFDEPLSSLDLDRKREILPFIQRLDKEFGLPIVYVTHSLGEVLQLTSTLVLLHGGSILAAGPINEVFARFDLPRALGKDLVGAVIDTTVAEHESGYGLTRLEFPGGQLYVPHQPRAIGEPLRVHVLSKDVSLVLGPPPARTSILNILEATVDEIGPVRPESPLVEVRLDIGCPLLASITAKSLGKLGLRKGQRVYAQIKAVALAEDLPDFSFS